MGHRIYQSNILMRYLITLHFYKEIFYFILFSFILLKKIYTKASDIYSFGMIMAELSSGKPPFYDKKHDFGLSLEMYSGLYPEFGKGTPEFYKKLACRCMNIDPSRRPTTNELYDILRFWRYSFVLESYRN